MKLITVVLCCIFVTVHSISDEFMTQTRSKIKKLSAECVKEENAQMSDLDIIMDLKIPESHEGKCVLFCVHKKIGIQAMDGSITRDSAMTTFEIVKNEDAVFHEKLVSTFDYCVPTVKNDDACLYASDLAVCFLKKAKEEGIHELIME